jgi:hypothetical protein
MGKVAGVAVAVGVRPVAVDTLRPEEESVVLQGRTAGAIALCAAPLCVVPLHLGGLPPQRLRCCSLEARQEQFDV